LGGIEWKPVEIPPRRAKFWQRIRREYELMRTLSHLVTDARGRHLLLLNAFNSTLLALSACRALSRRAPPAQVILHGTLNDLVGWRSRNPIARAVDLRSSMQLAARSKLQYLVLEETIRASVLNVLPRLAGCVGVIPHPVPVGEGSDDPQLPPLPLRIGFLGLASNSKGFPIFIDIARSLKATYPGRIGFHAVGRLPRESQGIDCSALDTPPSLGRLSRTEYVELLRSLHFVCLPFQGSHYQLAASGALLDAVAWSKPIIAFPTPLLQQWCRTSDIGYLCAHTGAMITTVARLIEAFDPSIYLAQARALREIRRSRLPDALAPLYRRLTVGFVSETSVRNQPTR
jgi:glycosyltransferase involved in cell wall biosynthesis